MPGPAPMSAPSLVCEASFVTTHVRAGNYSKFLEQRAQREAQERATAEAQQAEIARLETFVTRFGAKCALCGF